MPNDCPVTPVIAKERVKTKHVPIAVSHTCGKLPCKVEIDFGNLAAVAVNGRLLLTAEAAMKMAELLTLNALDADIHNRDAAIPAQQPHTGDLN